MFRKISIIAFLLINTNFIFGQKLKFGVHFDPAVIWLQSDVKDVISNKARLGFELGLSADYYFTKNYALATGISLFNTGGTLKYNNGIVLNSKVENKNIIVNTDDKVLYKIQYIKIPASLKLKTHEIGRFVYFANVGLDLLMRASAKANVNDDKNLKVNDDIKFFNLGWHFGGGAIYSLGGEASVFGGLSFMNTFTDITKPEHNSKITSNNLFLCIGVMF